MPFPSPGYIPDLGIETESPALQADSLPSELPGKLAMRPSKDGKTKKYKGTEKLKVIKCPWLISRKIQT